MLARGRLCAVFRGFFVSRRPASARSGYPMGSAFPLPPGALAAHTIRRMNCLMMDYPLTLSTIFRREKQSIRRQEIASRLADKSIHRYSDG